ncbi:MAG TPA: alpha/beta hydrolase, partial [Candidatus Hodarchaeales archaeon]|nr:alpha/beta hydrolase [Candidatus Hodarchaeales archaeon]
VFGRPVRNGIDLGINLVKTGVSVLQQGLQSLGSLSDILKSKRIAEDRNRSAPRIIFPFDEKTFQAKKLGLHYIDTGQAPGDSSEASPVAVFLPGLGLTHSIFERYFEEFYALGYRIISLDHRGHGKSDRPEKIKDLRHETMFEDWQEFFSKLGLDKPPLELTVITFSVTGVLFLHFLENRTINSLKQLIILSGSDYIPSNISKAARIIPPPAVWIPLKRQAVERGKKALFSKPDDLLVDRVLETLITMDPDCIQQLVKIIGEKSFEKSVNDRKIGDVPLLFLVGDRDPIFGPTVAQKSLEDSSTTRSWKQVENGSHFFPFEKTEETFVAIHRFIESNRVNRE